MRTPPAVICDSDSHHGSGGHQPDVRPRTWVGCTNPVLTAKTKGIGPLYPQNNIDFARTETIKRI